MSNATLIKIFRVLGWLEGGSFLLLMFVGMPMKYMAGDPTVVKMLGMPHGILFIAYVIMANIIAEEANWPMKVRVYAFLAAVLPFGTFVFELKYLNRAKSA